MAAIEASAWQDLYAGNHSRLDEALGKLLDRGKAAGEVRDEIDATDVILLLGALSRVPSAEWDTPGAHFWSRSSLTVCAAAEPRSGRNRI